MLENLTSWLSATNQAPPVGTAPQLRPVDIRPFSQQDPFRIEPFRRRYLRQVELRFQRFRSLLRRSIIDNDAFAIQAFEQQAAAGRADFSGPADLAAARFGSFVDQAASEIVLEEQQSEPYYALVVAAAYRQGVNQAVQVVETSGAELLRDEIALLRSSQHQQALRLAQRTQFELLKDVTSEMAANLRAVAVEGLEKGWTRQKLAAEMFLRTDKISFNRAKTIAATEPTAIHAEATLNTYEGLGVTRVTALVEFTLNVHGSSPPCPQCIALEGQLFSTGEARGILPVHPRCQCGWVPVLVQ